MGLKKTFFSNLLNLIKKDEIAVVLKQLEVLFENSPILKNEIVHLSSRFNTIRTQIRKGLVNHEDANVTQNKIKAGLLELLQEIEEKSKASFIHQEMEQAISIVNSKNIVTGNIIADGDVHIGDIIIKEIRDEKIILDINGKLQEINKELSSLKAFMFKNRAQKIKYAQKIYNIENINTANFGIVISTRNFNSILIKKMITRYAEKFKDIDNFLNELLVDGHTNWEENKDYLKQARAKLQNKFVWILKTELMRLFSVEKERSLPAHEKSKMYIEYCFSLYRHSLQLVNFFFLSKLWDEKKANPEIHTNYPILKKYFSKCIKFTQEEHFELFQTLLNVFHDNNLAFPISKENMGNMDEYLNSSSEFNKSASILKKLKEYNGTYDLAQSHTAEIALTNILVQFSFLADFQIISMRNMEYEKMRTKKPRYIKKFNVLGNRYDGKRTQQKLKYDNQPSISYSVFFIDKNQNRTNLFPFVIDFNAFSGDSGSPSQICFYECREGESGMHYYSMDKKKEVPITYRAIRTKKIFNDIELEKQKNIRLDLVFKEFRLAAKAILDIETNFVPFKEESDDFESI